MRVRAVVCDDEPLARRAIVEYLSDVEWVVIVAEASEGNEAVRLIHKHEPDLVFLDVRMPGMNGLQVLDALEHEPTVVFTTAFDEYAVAAFEQGAVDYLVKPFGQKRLLQTLDRVRVRLLGEGRTTSSGSASRPDPSDSPAHRLFAKHRGGMVPVAVDRIARVDAVDGGVSLWVDGRALTMQSTLGELERRLDPRTFVRVHRGHIVNLDRVSSIKRYDERRLVLVLDDGTKLITSRNGSQALRAMMDA